MDEKVIEINNPYLFTCIINANVKEMDKFEYDQDSEEVLYVKKG